MIYLFLKIGVAIKLGDYKSVTLFLSFRVIEHGEANRMTTQSVAIVFGPTLLRPETETGNMAVHMVYQNQIVELILLEYDNIFGR